MSTLTDAEKARYEEDAREGLHSAADSLQELTRILYYTQDVARAQENQVMHDLACKAIEMMTATVLAVESVRVSHERLT